MRKKKGIRAVVTGMLCSIVLTALMPLSASGVEYTPLAIVGSGLKYPTDVAASDAGTIYAIDPVGKKLLIYNSSYRLTAYVYSVAHPTTVAVSGDKVYVGDAVTKAVKILNSTGTVIGDLKKDGSTASFRLVRNIAVDDGGNVYVVDQHNNTIEVFDSSGTYSYTITGLKMPQDAVAVGSELFIIDQPLKSTGTTGGTSDPSVLHLPEVRIFDLVTQTFVVDETRTFPDNGNDTTLGQFLSLKGIAADSQNNLYLTDAYLHVLYKYDTNGQFLGAINEPLETPMGATVSPDGRLVVCSTHEARIKVFGVDYIAGADTWLNDAPVADAGVDQTVSEEADFVLDGSGSFDRDGISNYQWTQIVGPPVLPSNPFDTDSSQVPLTAPATDPGGAELKFILVVTDGLNKTSGVSVTQVMVANTISGSVVINDGDLYTNDELVTLSLDAPEAVGMRFANDSEPFSGAYYAYSPSSTWNLSAYDPASEANTKTVSVEFRDAGGSTTVASSSILLDMQAPEAPGIDTSGAAGELGWATVEGAVSYTLEYAFSSDFSDAVALTGLDYTAVTISLEGLEYGTWFWRVASTDVAGNVSGWSDVGTFVHARPNDPPVADAGADQTVSENTTFILDASASTDDKGIVSYTWTQTGGTPVLAEDPFVTETATLEVTAPEVTPEGETLVFELVVTDTFAEISPVASTEVTVNNTISGSLVINDAALITNDVLVSLAFDAPEAVEMRLANDSEPFEETFIAYSANYAWTLSGYDPAIPENDKTVRVEFKDAGGNTTVASSSILLDMGPPAAPVIDTSGTAGEFNWAPVGDAASYILEYAFASDFSDSITLTGLDYNGVTVALEDFDHVNSFGTWYWRVQSIDAAGNIGDWSDVGNFYIAPDCDVVVPEIPQLAWPLAGSADISRTALLEIDDIDYPAECGVHQRTEWQISEVADFSTLVMHIDTLNYPTMHQVQDLMLDPATAYYWRVKQVADSGMESDWSEAWSFTTVDDYDVLGVNGIILDESIEIKKGIITLKQAVGDTDIELRYIEISDGTVPLLMKELDPAMIPDMENRPERFPYGLLSYRIAVEPGGSILMEVFFSEESPAGGAEVGVVYSHEEGWHAHDNVLYQEQYRSLLINWQDGGIGDADGVINGIIVSP